MGTVSTGPERRSSKAFLPARGFTSNGRVICHGFSSLLVAASGSGSGAGVGNFFTVAARFCVVFVVSSLAGSVVLLAASCSGDVSSVAVSVAAVSAVPVSSDC